MKLITRSLSKEEIKRLGFDKLGDTPPPPPRVPKTHPSLNQDLLGNRVEKFLKRVGITKKRYTSLKVLFYLPATCKCEERMGYLNSLHLNAREVGWAQALWGESKKIFAAIKQRCFTV